MSQSILIADDDPIVREGLRSALLEAGYQVMEASDGRQALEMAIAHLPHLLLLDIEMPKINGFEVCQRIRKSEISRRLPVIMLTGCDEIEEIRNGLVLGADLYLTKPVSSKEILRSVQSMLSIY